MHIWQWSSLLALPVWLQFACAGAATSNEEDRPHESDSANQQEPLVGLCPDYTTYARHIQ
jgi:hypothetical protein